MGQIHALYGSAMGSRRHWRKITIAPQFLEADAKLIVRPWKMGNTNTTP